MRQRTKTLGDYATGNEVTEILYQAAKAKNFVYYLRDCADCGNLPDTDPRYAEVDTPLRDAHGRLIVYPKTVYDD